MAYELLHEIEDLREDTIAREVLKQRGPFLAAPEGLIYQYQKEGYWKLLSHGELQKEVFKCSKLGWYARIPSRHGHVPSPLRITSYFMNCVANLMMYADLQKFEPSPGIALRNGFLTIGGLKENKPMNFAGRYLDLEYRPSAHPSKFLQMLAEIFGKDSPEWAQDKIRTLQKFFGACLFGLATRYSKALILLGAGANGKSTLQEVVEHAIFMGRSSSVHPTKWSREYYVAGLFNSDLNTVSELPKNEELSPDVFKAVISGEAIQGRLPKEKPFKFAPTAGHVFSANNLPQTDDTSEGFWRRVIIIPFTQDFRKVSNASKDDIKAPILAEEREGILNWAFEGAKALVADGGYNIGEWHTTAINEWRDESNSVRPFLSECTKKADDPNYRCSSAELYDDYKFWCWQNGIHPLGRPAFGRVLSDSLTRFKSNGLIFYLGIKVNPRHEWEITKIRRNRGTPTRLS